jgi:hypothetical protein
MQQNLRPKFEILQLPTLAYPACRLDNVEVEPHTHSPAAPATVRQRTVRRLYWTRNLPMKGTR